MCDKDTNVPNKTDFISREAALEIVINYEFENCPDYMRDFATKLKSAVCSDIRTDLQAIPAADVRPVVRGEWIETGYFDPDYQPIYECSHCHREVADSFVAKHLFCLHCGADMREVRT